MQRIILLLTVGALMVLALAVPAFAQAEHFESQGTIHFQPADCQGVVTPSGNENAKCSIKPEGGNKGGTGGGGAETANEPFSFYESFDPEAHIVTTPSGNQKIVGHTK
jgi:hypothetical protein